MSQWMSLAVFTKITLNEKFLLLHWLLFSLSWWWLIGWRLLSDGNCNIIAKRQGRHTTFWYARMTFVVKTISEELSYLTTKKGNKIERRPRRSEECTDERQHRLNKPSMPSGTAETRWKSMSLARLYQHCWLNKNVIAGYTNIEFLREETDIEIPFICWLVARHVRWFSMSLMGFTVMLFVHFIPFVIFVALFLFLFFLRYVWHVLPK